MQWNFQFKKQKKSLEKYLFLDFVFLSLIMSVLFGSLMAVTLYYQGIEGAHAVIRNKNEAATGYLHGYFKPLRSAIESISNHSALVGSDGAPSDHKKVLSLYKVISRALPNINYIYSGYEDGTLLINDYTPPEGFEPQKRPWYQAALASNPRISGGIPYKEAKTNEWMVSLSKVITDGGENMKGVVAIDTSMNQITKNLFERDLAFPSSYSFVVDSRGDVIIHHREKLIGKNFQASVTTDDDLSRYQGRLEYTFEGIDKIAYYKTIKSLSWTVVTVVNKSDFLHEVLVNIILSLLVVAAVSLIVAKLISHTLSQKIISPLRLLEARLNSILSGKKTDQPTGSISDFIEINEITQGIEKLTHQSLLEKNLALEDKNKLLTQLSETDHLTGLLNRRKFNEILEKEYQRAQRYKTRFSVMLLDIDWFKAVNDTYGHDAGDRVLKEVSETLSSILRSADSLARWGGEEFLILCPETGLDGAAVIAQKVRAAVEALDFSVPTNVTVSVGVCEYSTHFSIDDLLVEVDHKLYQAKSDGRNTVATC